MMIAGDHVDPDAHVESASGNPSDTGLDIEHRVLNELGPDTSRDDAALELLGDPELLDRFLALGSSVGIVGEKRTARAHAKWLGKIEAAWLLYDSMLDATRLPKSLQGRTIGTS